jgi:hypothetical protein
MTDIAEDLTPFKRAYSRALNYVCQRHFQAVSTKPGDDPFFASPDGNCCASDVLIAELEKSKPNPNPLPPVADIPEENAFYDKIDPPQTQQQTKP